MMQMPSGSWYSVLKGLRQRKIPLGAVHDEVERGQERIGQGVVLASSTSVKYNFSMTTQAGKGTIFRTLHERDEAFIIPNPYDAGTAKLLAHLGFEALATTSAGYAFTVGKPDNQVGRDAMLKHVAEIVNATDLPVSADLENGFGNDPETVAETVRLAAKAGLAGCSIEDMGFDGTIYEFDLAVERVRAATVASRDLPFIFTLTARCENFLVGRTDLDDTIRRLQAYQEAGADVLYAPGITARQDISAVISSVDRPVNILAGPSMNLKELSDLGAKRISVGSALTRSAIGAFMRAAGEMKESGAFKFIDEGIGFGEINGIFKN
jgi:2-methylisocitrate lyase-like PEP mutase family enzyme